MSFILDALRKSERERQRNRGPGLAGTHAGGNSPRRNLWIPLVALLLGLNLSLLGVMWWTNRPEPATATLPDDMLERFRPVEATPQPAPPAAMPAAPADPRRSLADELVPAPAPQATAQATAAGAASAPAAPRRASVPTMTELLLDGSLNLPPLHLDVHVYSQSADERFVFINTARYREGERLTEGPEVSEIRSDGVILNYQGRNFLLMRE